MYSSPTSWSVQSFIPEAGDLDNITEALASSVLAIFYEHEVRGLSYEGGIEEHKGTCNLWIFGWECAL